MGTLNELVTYLAANGVSGVKRGSLPSGTGAGTALYEYPGEPSQKGFGVDGIQYEYPRVQFVARGVPGDFDGPRAVAETAYVALGKIEATTLSGTEFLLVTPTAPFLLKRDEQDRVHIAVNCRIEKAPSA